MKNNDLVIWTDSPDIIHEKCIHARKIGGRTYGGFNTFYGDIPVFRFNSITGKPEEVVNPRGRAYGLRKAKKYRKNKKYM